MECAPESCLHEHVQSKHQAVSPTSRCRQDHSNAFVSFRQVSAHNNADPENGVSDSVVLQVDCCEDHGHKYEPIHMYVGQSRVSVCVDMLRKRKAFPSLSSNLRSISTGEDDAHMPQVERNDGPNKTDREPH